MHHKRKLNKANLVFCYCHGNHWNPQVSKALYGPFLLLNPAFALILLLQGRSNKTTSILEPESSCINRIVENRHKPEYHINARVRVSKENRRTLSFLKLTYSIWLDDQRRKTSCAHSVESLAGSKRCPDKRTEHSNRLLLNLKFPEVHSSSIHSKIYSYLLLAPSESELQCLMLIKGIKTFL